MPTDIKLLNDAQYIIDTRGDQKRYDEQIKISFDQIYMPEARKVTENPEHSE